MWTLLPKLVSFARNAEKQPFYRDFVFKALKLNETCVGSTAINGIDDHIIVNT